MGEQSTILQSVAKCTACGSLETKLRPVKLVTGTFCGGLKVVDEYFCYGCLRKEFFYVDNNGTVKFNIVKTETTSSIKEQ